MKAVIRQVQLRRNVKKKNRVTKRGKRLFENHTANLQLIADIFQTLLQILCAPYRLDPFLCPQLPVLNTLARTCIQVQK